MADPADAVSEDAFLGGRLWLRQPLTGHRAGHDAMLLACSTAARPGDRAIDFGAGVGAAGLALASRVSGLDLVLVDIDPALADLARGNATRNGLPAQVVTLDVAADARHFAAAGLPPDSANVVLMNPPFNDNVRHRASPSAGRERAHQATATTLADWVGAARRVLTSRGVLTMIWRADGLADVLSGLQRGFGSIAVQPVHGDEASPAIRILVRAIKGGRAPLALYPALRLNEPDAQLRDALAGQGGLPLAKL